MRVAVIGGTGFIGGYVVDALLAAGHEPVLLVRPGSERKLRQAGRCEIQPGEAGDRAAIAKLMKAAHAAVFLVGILREQASRGITFEALQFEAARRAIDCAAEQGVRRFVVAGGETSGAVTKALEVTRLTIGGEIAPGVPWTYTRSGGHDIALALKSGNFGTPTFFADALALLETS